MRRIRLVLISLLVALGTAVAFATPASATATTTVGLWNFSERSGPAVDSAGSPQNGTVGRLIQRNGSTYRFPTTQGLPASDHLVLVGNNNVLNPGTSDFAVTVRFKTARVASNVVQKGQAGTSGGYWKVEIHNGLATCQFHGSTGQQRAVLSKSRVDNAVWHTVRCDRTASGVSISVDGTRQRTLSGPTGFIANTLQMSIGGKSQCNQSTVGCDFFAGEISYVRVQKG